MDDWEFEDQTNQYNDGDTSTGNDYTGYTPGYDNSNIDTSWEDTNDYVDYGSYGGNQFSPTSPINTSAPDWFSSSNPAGVGSGGAPNPMGSTGTSYGGDIKSALSSLFQGGVSSGLLGKGVAALLEGNQNKQKAAAATALAKNAALDPFGSQRPFYQQQAQQAVTNPYDSPMVKAQIAQLQHAQDIKDAAAGRRSNQLTSAPAVLAAQAQIAQNYQQQMAQQGGSNIAPNQQLASILQSGSNAGINGYVSPFANAYGYGSQSNTNTAQLDALKKFLAGQS